MEKENLKNENDKELDEEFLAEEEFDTEEEFDDEDDIGFIGTEEDLDACTEDSIINDCVDEVLKNGSVSEEKEKTEQDTETDLLADPKTGDVDKEEYKGENDKPVSKKEPSLFQRWFHKSDTNNKGASDVPVISGIDMEKADIVISKKSRKRTEEGLIPEEECKTEIPKGAENETADTDEPFNLSDDEILGTDTGTSLPTNVPLTKESEEEEKKEKGQSHGKSLRMIVIISVGSVLSVLVILLIIFFLLKGDGPVSRIAKEHSLVSDVSMKDISVDEDLKSFIHSGMYYNIQNGYTHALGEEELDAVRKVFDGSNIIGSQISYEDYTAILESISSNSLNDLAFLILHKEDQNESIIILKAGDDLYFENESVPDTVWYLDKENENTVSLGNIMMMLSKLQGLEKQLNP